MSEVDWVCRRGKGKVGIGMIGNCVQDRNDATGMYRALVVLRFLEGDCWKCQLFAPFLLQAISSVILFLRLSYSSSAYSFFYSPFVPPLHVPETIQETLVHSTIMLVLTDESLLITRSPNNPIIYTINGCLMGTIFRLRPSPIHLSFSSFINSHPYYHGDTTPPFTPSPDFRADSALLVSLLL